MNILYLRGFNNYHKRTIIKYSTIQDYKSNSASFLDTSGVNFNPNDGVVAEIVVGNDSQKENNDILMFEDIGSPDYCVCYESDTNNNVTIKSRWFILESVRIRAGQYRLALKRDVIADHLDYLLDSNCFIEKGLISRADSPLLYNRESMTYNQIKKKEVSLFDSTGVAWIVGYIAKNYDTQANVTGKINNVIEGSGIDMSDTPWGSLSSEEIEEGITFDTVDSFNLFATAKIQYTQTPILINPSPVYQAKTGRAQMLLSNGDSLSNNTDYELYTKENKWHPNRDPEITGNGLGNYTNVNFYGYPNAQGVLLNRDISISASTFMSSLINETISGRTAYNTIITEMKANLSSRFNFYGDDGIMKFDGVQVQVDDGNGGYNYYTVKITKTGIQSDKVNRNTLLSSSTLSDLKNKFVSILNTAIGNNYYSATDVDLPIYLELCSYKIAFTHIVPTLQVDVHVPNIADRWGCNDQLFDMFCIPYGKLHIKDDVTAGGTVQDIYTNANAGLAAARAIATQYGSNLYDLQILPYCPIKEIRDSYELDLVDEIDDIPLTEPYFESDGYFEIDSDESSLDGMYQRITNHSDNSVMSYVFWCYESHGTFDIPIYSGTLKYCNYDTVISSNSLKKKVSSETELWRLCSPNYNGVFEWNPAKNNDGEVIIYGYRPGIPNPIRIGTGNRKVNVDFTYRPGNPYIHINPDFHNLYGQDFNDVRGLVCGGDFSLGYIVDAYRQYQIQNANFQNIFDRQIQNLDVNNAIAKEQTQFTATISAITAPLGGATGGALAGAKYGGAYGAVAGAVVGGIGGGIAGGVGYNLTMDWLERQQQETRQYSIDMYQFQLGNIKALPYSISRTDCLNENTRLFPFIEVYQCTEEEVGNLLNVIKYNGMTVMKIDRPRNYLGPNYDSQREVQVKDRFCTYVKGKIIMNEETELEDDFHILDALYAEFDKGVYIQSNPAL